MSRTLPTKKDKNPLRQTWETPDELFINLSQEFGFVLDACASQHNWKVPRYYDESSNGLKSPWKSTTWCNPPFSSVKKWVWKALHEQHERKVSSVLLIPSSVNSNYFADLIYPNARVWIMRGRTRFIPPPGIKASTPDGGCILVHFQGKKTRRTGVIGLRDHATGEVLEAANAMGDY